VRSRPDPPGRAIFNRYPQSFLTFRSLISKGKRPGTKFDHNFVWCDSLCLVGGPVLPWGRKVPMSGMCFLAPEGRHEEGEKGERKKNKGEGILSEANVPATDALDLLNLSEGGRGREPWLNFTAQCLSCAGHSATVGVDYP